MLKLTLPAEANLFAPLVDHPRVLRVVALSGGFSREEACRQLAQNRGMIASFSRALLSDLRHQMSDKEFDGALGTAIDDIHTASVRLTRRLRSRRHSRAAGACGAGQLARFDRGQRQAACHAVVDALAERQVARLAPACAGDLGADDGAARPHAARVDRAAAVLDDRARRDDAARRRASPRPRRARPSLRTGPGRVAQAPSASAASKGSDASHWTKLRLR